MDWHLLIGPAVVAAIVSGIIAIVGMVISARTARELHSEKLGADQRLAEGKFEFDKELAQRKFDLDRSQSIHKRQFELAETLLADAYRFRGLMGFVRNGAAFGNEGETRSSDEYESENVKRLRNTYFVPIERLQKENEFLSAFMAKAHTAQAHFGPDAEKAFFLMSQSIHEVRTAAYVLIRSVEEGRHNSDQVFLEEQRKVIWAPLASFKGGYDKTGSQIEEAVALIEGFCHPVLKWKGA
jgi:hypothetical protein